VNVPEPEEAAVQGQREQVIVLAQRELDRVDVNRVDVGPGRGHLRVVVLVHEPVHALHVQEPVQQRVEEIVYNEQRHDRYERIEHGDIRQVPPHRRFEVRVPEVKVYERSRRDFANADEYQVLRRQVVQVLSPYRNQFRTEPFLCVRFIYLFVRVYCRFPSGRDKKKERKREWIVSGRFAVHT